MPRGVPQQSYKCLGPNDIEGPGEGLCGRPTVARSLCSTHNRRFLRRGTLDRHRAPFGYFTPCKHPDGCPTPAQTGGWCSKHAVRIENHGEPGPVGEWVHDPDPGTCKHPDGCPRPRRSAGWCSMHYVRQLYSPTGDPGPVGITPGYEGRRQVSGPCKHPDGCPRIGNGGDGWCPMHGERVRKTGDAGPVGPRMKRSNLRPAV